MSDLRSSIVAVASLLVAGLALPLVSPGRAEAQGAVAFNPSVGLIPDGVGLGVTPVVTADRRYVRLGVNANFSTINGFMTLPVPAAVAGGGNQGGAGGFRNVGLADQGVPYNLEYLEASRKAAQAQAQPGKPGVALPRTPRGKKPLADPVMVPMKKGPPRANANAPKG
jgi:hypothetical protein